MCRKAVGTATEIHPERRGFVTIGSNSLTEKRKPNKGTEFHHHKFAGTLRWSVSLYHHRMTSIFVGRRLVMVLLPPDPKKTTKPNRLVSRCFHTHTHSENCVLWHVATSIAAKLLQAFSHSCGISSSFAVTPCDNTSIFQNGCKCTVGGLKMPDIL